MSYIALIYPHTPGHSNPFIWLSKELTRRGHTVKHFDFTFGCETDFNALKHLTGEDAGKVTKAIFEKQSDKSVKIFLATFSKKRPDFLLFDDYHERAGLIAEILSIPLAVLSLAFPRNNGYRVNSKNHIAQIPAAFAYGIDVTPVGPLHDVPAELPPKSEFIYACLGTIHTGNAEIYNVITQACSQLEIPLLLSFGGTIHKSYDYIYGKTHILEYCNQRELLKSASLCITHAGMNTVLEALATATPMVAIPLANDQFENAALIEKEGFGVTCNHKDLTVRSLKKAIQKVWRNGKRKSACMAMREHILKCGREGQAADIIEALLVP